MQTLYAHEGHQAHSHVDKEKTIHVSDLVANIFFIIALGAVFLLFKRGLSFLD